MPTYKLSYFDFTGLGEPIRFLLNYGGVKFEDNRISWEGDQWQKLKPTMPFGQMPVLEIDGKQTHQHLAICRYLGKQFGIAGSNDWENLQIDIIADTINDLRLKLGEIHWETDQELKEKKFAEVEKEYIPTYLKKIDAIAKENNGYLANGKLSWVDLYFVSLFEYLDLITRTKITEKYPNIKKVKDNVYAIPAIKEWIAKRPPVSM